MTGVTFGRALGEVQLTLNLSQLFLGCGILLPLLWWLKMRSRMPAVMKARLHRQTSKNHEGPL